MAGCCEYGNEPLSYIKLKKPFLLAEELLASQEGLCCMQLDRQSFSHPSTVSTVWYHQIVCRIVVPAVQQIVFRIIGVSDFSLIQRRVMPYIYYVAAHGRMPKLKEAAVTHLNGLSQHTCQSESGETRIAVKTEIRTWYLSNKRQ